MSLASILALDAALGLLTIAAVAALMLLAGRLPDEAPQDDESWGRSGDPWVASDSLPLAQLAAHEHGRRLARAA